MKNLFSTLALLTMTMSLAAHDFVSNSPDGQKLYFNVTDVRKQTVEVTFEGKATKRTASAASGELQIPATVKWNDKIYSVTSIGTKAFAGATHLTSVVFPNGITQMGDFAFEGCALLKTIVFPGNEVKFGEGVFYQCSSIQNVSLGSDWKQANLQMFRWSDQLNELFIPAKVVQLNNIKSLKQLHTLRVDANNPAYCSDKGMLYTRDGKTLLACPRNYYGVAEVAEGTEVILKGAFADCPKIRKVEFPTTLQSLSYEEFAQQQNLDTLCFKSERPVKTAIHKGREVFALKVANRKMVVLQPWKARKEYKKLRSVEAGEYQDRQAVLEMLPEKSARKGRVPKSLLEKELLQKSQFHYTF